MAAAGNGGGGAAAGIAANADKTAATGDFIAAGIRGAAAIAALPLGA
jgi:hypothetical protein